MFFVLDVVALCCSTLVVRHFHVLWCCFCVVAFGVLRLHIVGTKHVLHISAQHVLREQVFGLRMSHCFLMCWLGWIDCGLSELGVAGVGCGLVFESAPDMCHTCAMRAVGGSMFKCCKPTLRFVAFCHSLVGCARAFGNILR